MRLLRTFPILAHAVVLLSIVGVSVATRSAGLLLVGGVLAALSWYVTEGHRGRSLPNWTANILIIAATLNVLVDLVQNIDDILGALGRFVVMLTLIKLYQQKSPRDYAQLLGLSLLLMLVGCIQSNNLLFAATLLLYTVLGLYVLLVFQLYAAHERNRAARLDAIPAGYRLAPSLQPIVGRRTAFHLRSLMAFIAVGGLVTSGLLFVLFPRNVGQGLARLHSTDRQTGYTDEVNLTSGTRITESRRVVMSLRVTGLPPHELLHLRGAVLDRYHGLGRWSISAPYQHKHPVTTEPPGLTALCPDTTGRAILQEFELLAPTPTIFSVAVPVAVGTREPYRLHFDRQTGTLIDPGSGRLQHYTVKAQTNPSEATLRALTGPTPGLGGASLVRQFQSFDPRVRRLARGLLATAGVGDGPPDDEQSRWEWNRAAANVLMAFLQSGRFGYETDLRHVRTTGADGVHRDPTLQFLFETHIGHCEYFASALAVLCNTAGVPARVVTGYVALEYDDRWGLYIVRESNAHAWVEVQTSPYRWETFDPTPPATLQNIHAARNTRADRWRWIFDRLEATWSNNFVAFDNHTQRQLLVALDFGWARRLDDALYATRQWMAGVNRAFYLGPAGYIWMGIVALAVVIAAIAVWTRLRRAARLRATLKVRHVSGSAHHRMLSQLGFYMDMLTVLSAADRAKPAWQPPLEYAHVLVREHPAGGALTKQLTELFYAARYGGKSLTGAELRHARSLVTELRAALDG